MERTEEKVQLATRGAAAGLAATGIMTMAMEAVRWATSFRRQPPRLIVRTVLTGRPERPVRGEAPLALLAHAGYGASCGALFALLTRRSHGLGSGVAFGLLLWAVSYLGWVPAAGAMAPPQHDDPGRQSGLIVGHVVYGAVLSAVLHRLRRPRRRAANCSRHCADQC